MTHWSERTSCLCGKTFRAGSLSEARHRHNFPALCKDRKKLAKRIAELDAEVIERAKRAAAAGPAPMRDGRVRHRRTK